jgi:hypothetical protein
MRLRHSDRDTQLPIAIMADFKAKAVAATEPDDMWSMQEHLLRTRRETGQKYDCRSSRLPFVFDKAHEMHFIPAADP